MTIRRLSISTHWLLALLTVGAASLSFSVVRSPWLAGALAVAVSTLLSFTVGWWWSVRIHLGLRLIEDSLATGEHPQGESEFHRCATTLHAHVQRWVDAAAVGRQQMREVEMILSSVDRRGANRNDQRDAARELRMLLASLGQDTQETLRRLIACNSEIDRVGQRLLAGAQQQEDTATRTTRQVGELAAGIETAETSTERSQSALKQLVEAAASAAEEVRQFHQGMEHISEEAVARETKVRLLREHTAEIATLVHSIGEITARTDMLALNASIESVRAGEHGRGFAVVADEIRKLSSQAAKSSAEVLDRIASIETEIDATTNVMVHERTGLDQESERVGKVGRSLHIVQDATGQFRDYLQQASLVSDVQLRRTHEISTALKEVVETADASRDAAKDACARTRSLTELIVRLADVLEPLLLSARDRTAVNTSREEHLSLCDTSVENSRDTSTEGIEVALEDVPELVAG